MSFLYTCNVVFVYKMFAKWRGYDTLNGASKSPIWKAVRLSISSQSWLPWPLLSDIFHHNTKTNLIPTCFKIYCNLFSKYWQWYIACSVFNIMAILVTSYLYWQYFIVCSASNIMAMIVTSYLRSDPRLIHHSLTKICNHRHHRYDHRQPSSSSLWSGTTIIIIITSPCHYTSLTLSCRYMHIIYVINDCIVSRP